MIIQRCPIYCNTIGLELHTNVVTLLVCLYDARFLIPSHYLCVNDSTMSMCDVYVTSISPFSITFSINLILH